MLLILSITFFGLGKENVSDSASVELNIPLESGSMEHAKVTLQTSMSSVAPGLPDAKPTEKIPKKVISLSTILPQTVTDVSDSSEGSESDTVPSDLLVTVATEADLSEEVFLSSENQTEQIEVGPIRTPVDTLLRSDLSEPVETATSIALTKEDARLAIQPTKKSMEAKTDLKLTTVVVPKESLTDHPELLAGKDDNGDGLPDEGPVASSSVPDVVKVSKTFLDENATMTPNVLMSSTTLFESKRPPVASYTKSYDTSAFTATDRTKMGHVESKEKEVPSVESTMRSLHPESDSVELPRSTLVVTEANDILKQEGEVGRDEEPRDHDVIASTPGMLQEKTNGKIDQKHDWTSEGSTGERQPDLGFPREISTVSLAVDPEGIASTESAVFRDATKMVTPSSASKREHSLSLVSETPGDQVVKDGVTAVAGKTTEATITTQDELSTKYQIMGKVTAAPDSTARVSKLPLSPEHDMAAEGSAYGETYVTTKTLSPSVQTTAYETATKPDAIAPTVGKSADTEKVDTSTILSPERTEDAIGTGPIATATSKPTVISGIATSTVAVVDKIHPTSASKPLITKTQPPLIDRESEEDPNKVVIIDESVSPIKTTTDDDFTGSTLEPDIDNEYFTSSSVTAVVQPTGRPTEVLEEESLSTPDAGIGVESGMKVFIVAIPGNDTGKAPFLGQMPKIMDVQL